MKGVCFVPPHPEVAARIVAERETRKAELASMSMAQQASALGLPPQMHRIGYNDGVFYPPGAGPSPAPPATQPVPQRPPSTGDIHALVLLVDFPDLQGSTSNSHFEDLLFGTASTSLSTYYKEASYGLLNVTGEVVGWLTMPKNQDYYTDNKSAMGSYPRNGQRLAEDAIDAAVMHGVDLAKFDANRDGFLDGLIIVHAGQGAETEKDKNLRLDMIWSHKSTLSQSVTSNGVQAYAYTLQPEDGRIGVFCHEFGHFLGLPDLYDTSSRSRGVGDWCLMGSGCWLGDGTEESKGKQPGDLGAWARAQLGWAAPRTISGSNQSFHIGPAHAHREIVRLNLEHAPKEHYLLEARQCDGLDKALPGEGLLVWHIDDGQRDNDKPPRYMVGLVEGDGNHHLLYNQNAGDAGDPFPGTSGRTYFDRSSHPLANDHSGRDSGVEIRQITRHSDGTVEATVTAP